MKSDQDRALSLVDKIKHPDVRDYILNWASNDENIDLLPRCKNLIGSTDDSAIDKLRIDWKVIGLYKSTSRAIILIDAVGGDMCVYLGNYRYGIFIFKNKSAPFIEIISEFSILREDNLIVVWWDKGGALKENERLQALTFSCYEPN